MNSMARTGQTLKTIFDKAEEILGKTVLTYKENCVIPGYEITYKVVFQDKHSLIYKLQVCHSSIKRFTNINVLMLLGEANRKRFRSDYHVHHSQ